MAKMRFREIANRLTGFSTAVFGVSWNPPTLEIDIARPLISFLEDRRVLYAPYHDEEMEYANRSVLDIRKRLTSDLEKLDRSGDLARIITDMRAACRRFLTKTQHIDPRDIRRRYGFARFDWDDPVVEYFVALGEFRAIMGVHIAQIAVKYGIDVESQLAKIFPEATSDEDDV